MLFVDGLPAHAHAFRDGLPRPTLLARFRDLQRLEPLGEFAEPRDCAQSDGGIAARGLFGKLDLIAHGVNVG